MPTEKQVVWRIGGLLVSATVIAAAIACWLLRWRQKLSDFARNRLPQDAGVRRKDASETLPSYSLLSRRETEWTLAYSLHPIAESESVDKVSKSEIRHM